jgi:23S rRNA pseudouridine1911/1915/1917 synthase
MAVLPDGKEAITDFQLLAAQDPFSLVLAKPKTGRTHQIRVHLKHLGTPVVGDRLYGATRPDAERHLLHAYRLSLTHPISKMPLELVAPMPEDFRRWLSRFALPQAQAALVFN